MGLGVFAGRALTRGEVLDEYLGELIPSSLAAQRNDDNYSFTIMGSPITSTARDYGNWTRFVNHRCVTYNVEARNDVCGGRRTITFRALRSIPQGEQLFIDYGPGYFGDKDYFLLCECPDFQGQHLPPATVSKGTKRKADSEAAPSGRERKRTRTRKRPDLTIPEQNAWITEEKAWLDQQIPNGYPEWTRVHWRLLEQLIRRRRNHKDWRDKTEFGKLTSSRGDALINRLITTSIPDDNDGTVRVRTAQMTIKEWHLDVTKAFIRDPVCGTRQGVPWATNELLRRVFALVVAARQRRRRSKRRNSYSKTPPTSPTAVLPGGIPTPPTIPR
ncbi:set-domain histone methyltransferase-5 [Diaporthe helianthi]|uniref:Set-domain histone methyltransferase-5 n=1 Tax=Diaporthe helianthi TaxID=158607 RepID=A0A2P5HRK0_DIAHE|nr:set-domain histone methyltransferase-5 [Diaporthe helianthi]